MMYTPYGIDRCRAARPHGSDRPTTGIPIGPYLHLHRNDYRAVSALAARYSSSRRQPFVGQPPLGNAVNETVEPLSCVASDVAVIQPESKLVNVPARMVRADMVEGAVDATFQYRPDRFNAVGGNVAVDVGLNVLACAVVDRLVPEEKPVHSEIGFRLVGMQRRSLFHSRVYDGLQGSGLRVTDRQQDRFAVPLAQSHDRSLADRATAEPELFPLMFIGFLPADICFVNFDVAGQDRFVIPARFPNAVHHEPRGLLRDSNFLRQLQRRNRLAGRDHEVHGVNPLVERNVGPLEDCSCPDSEVFVAGVAAVEAFLATSDALARITYRADGAVRPQPTLQIQPRCFGVWEHFEDLERADRALAHLPFLPKRPRCQP